MIWLFFISVLFYLIIYIYWELTLFELCNWFPWLSFWNESWLLQLLIVVLLYFMLINSSAYMVLFYLLLQLLMLGIHLSFCQLELFTAFLWVIELTIILVCLLLLFYFNASSLQPYFNFYTLRSYIYCLFFIFILVGAGCIDGFFEFLDFKWQSFFFLWNDYYEAIMLKASNDVYSLTVSYYTVNSFELLLVGFLLFIGSVICVNFNKYQRYNRNFKLPEELDIINVYNFLLNSFFIRKQNMTDQNSKKANLNIFKKNKTKKTAYTSD